MSLLISYELRELQNKKKKMCFLFCSSHIYMIFKYSQAFIHHFMGLFVTNINLNNDQLPDGLSAQFVEHCTGITEVMGSNLLHA